MIRMRNEILDSIDEYYGDDIDTKVDCYQYLAEISKGSDKVLSWMCESNMLGLGRCPKCGTPLTDESYRMSHDELDYPTSEVWTVRRCHNCGYVDY